MPHNVGQSGGMSKLLLISIQLLLAGCATKPPPQPLPPEPPLPGPSNFSTSMILTARQFGVDGRLQATVKAEAISARPLRSKYEGQLTAVLVQGKEPLLDVQAVVSGEYEGSPGGGMTEALTRFLSAIELASRAATRPTSRPAAP